MKKRIVGLLFSLFLLSAHAAQAIPGGVKGKIIDSKTKEAIEYVNIKITPKGGTSLLQGGISDLEGSFQLGGLKAGTYDISFSCMGYTPLKKEIRLTSPSQIIDLKSILLETNEQMLQEVQVTGQRSQMKFEIDKKVFNVGQDLSSAGESASEVLSNVPSVEVDNEGEVSLRGNTSVTIWINGKESGLTADNRAQILQQLPAESIDRIEVITNPSAKFSPEGTAGIINIILKENRKAGYFGSVQAGANSRGGANTGANINYSSSKLDANASIGYRHNKRTGGNITERTNLPDHSYLNSNSDDDGTGNHIFARAGMTYHPTKTNEFSLTGFGMFGDNKSNTLLNYDATSYRSLRNSNSDNNMKGGNVSLGYKHNFNNTDHYLDFTTSYNAWGMDNNSIFDQTYENNPDRMIYQSQDNKMRNHNWAIQLDYSNKLNDRSKVEAGYKGTLSRENSPVETSSGRTVEDAQPDYSLYNRFIYNQDIHALYATYSGKAGNFGFQVGMRGEYTKVDTRSNKTDMGTEITGTLFTKDYFSLFPSAFLTYSLPGHNEVQFNYSRRISRPWGGQLNSFQNITDSTNISSGNPELMPQYANAYELNYIKTWDYHTFSTSVYYRTTDDVIQRVSYMTDNVMYSTFVNVAKTQSAGVELVGKNKLTRWLDLTSTVNLYYYKLNGFEYKERFYDAQEQFSWNARIIANVILPYSISFQATGNYRSRQAVAQGTQKANYSLDAGIKKNFLNKTLSVSINARDILDSRRWKTETSGENFIQYSERWRGGRQFGVTVTYNFGNMKAKMTKKPNNSENNDNYYDTMGGEQ